MKIQFIELPIIGGYDNFMDWAEHFGLTVSQSNPKKAECRIGYTHAPALFWFGANVSSGLPAPKFQTRQGNSDYIKKYLGQDTEENNHWKGHPDAMRKKVDQAKDLLEEMEQETCANCGKPINAHFPPHNKCP